MRFVALTLYRLRPSFNSSVNSRYKIEFAFHYINAFGGLFYSKYTALFVIPMFVIQMFVIPMFVKLITNAEESTVTKIVT